MEGGAAVEEAVLCNGEGGGVEEGDVGGTDAPRNDDGCSSAADAGEVLQS